MITWDEPKRLQNLAKHGLDFAEFEIWFDMDSAVVVPGHSDRFKMVGFSEGSCWLRQSHPIWAPKHWR